MHPALGTCWKVNVPDTNVPGVLPSTILSLPVLQGPAAKEMRQIVERYFTHTTLGWMRFLAEGSRENFLRLLAADFDCAAYELMKRRKPSARRDAAIAAARALVIQHIGDAVHAHAVATKTLYDFIDAALKTD